MPLQFLDLFAGIGGMRRGLENARMQCVGSVERDKFARLSYQSIFQTKGEWSADDIHTVEPDSMPGADIWTFGFPCQDLSVAEKRQGFGGERSNLFFKVLDLVRTRPEADRPEWLVAENVVGFLSSNQGLSLPPKLRWPKSGTTVNGTCVTRPRSVSPNTGIEYSLSAMLEAEIDERYFLSSST